MDLGDLMAGTPDLTTGHCVGLWTLFDPQGDDEPQDVVDNRHAVAVALCQACPVAAACAEWFSGLPPQDRPTGVVAGKVRLGRGHRKNLKKENVA